MLSNLKIKKIGACCGILSIFLSNIAVAMQPEPGVLAIHGKQSLQIVGQPQPLAIPEDISRLSYEDFDITAHLSEMPFPKGVPVWPREKRKVESWHLDTNIPYIAGANPTIDYDSLRAIPFFIAKYLNDKIHPSKQAGAKDFFEKTIIPNQQTLSSGTQEIPDLDCLYYKAVSGNQHLFLRLSSLTRKEAEIFKQRANGKTLFVESGELKLLSDGSMVLDHVNAEADKITVEAKDTIFNRASKMKAKWIIRLKAGKQRNETVINKWVRESKGKHHFAHAEGVESIDDCSFIAKKVVQEGDEVENYGIFVEADKFEDRATHTLNMPAKITLVNYAWEEDDDMFSSATSSVRQTDDVLVPTRYHVNYYRSASDTEGSSVKFGYTIVNSGSKIEVLKDTKEDVVIDEQHTIEIHEETSGFSICGGVSVPDPTSRLQQIRATHKSGNTIWLTAAAIGAVANGIQAYEDYKIAETLVNHKNPWSMEQATALLQTLSHYVHGPSIQFGNRSVDLTQQTTLTHGNTFIAPTQIFHNSVLSSFGGTYLAENMDIKTKTFVTFDLPQTTHSEMTMHQSGVSMDLLSFAVSLMNPAVGSALDAALSASSVTIGFQNGESSQTIHKPTVLQAEHKLDIEAESGQLTQAQIKAGIVHAVFTKDSVLETLANEKWRRKKGGNLAFGLSGLAEFKTLADVLQNAVTSAHISNIDSSSFEKVIDDFASMVGEEEFYLKVGGILKTKSAFLGHATHDPTHEHIEAKERQDIKVEELHEAYDRSFDLSVGDLMTIVSTLKQQIKDEAIAEGMSQDEAEPKAEQRKQKLIQDLNTEKAKVDTMAELIDDTEKSLRDEIESSIGDSEVKKLAEGKSISTENRTKVVKSLSKSIQRLVKEKAELNLHASSKLNEVQQASLQTQNELIDEKLQQYSLLSKFLNRTESPKMTRSNSADNLLQDTYIRQGQRAFGIVAGSFTGLAHEADSMNYHDYVELQRFRLPVEAQNNPEVLAKLGVGYALYKGAAKVGQGISELDDATGNVVSRAMHKLGEGFEWLGTHTRRFVRDDLGFSQRVGQNTGDVVQIAAEIFAPGTVIKGVGSVSRIVGASKFSSALGEKFGLFKGDISGAKIGLNWNGAILGEQSYGMAFENYLATLPEFSGIRLPKNFKTFDFWDADTGRAVSAKTLNTNTPARLLNPEGIYSTLKGYVDKTLNFTYYDKGLFPENVSALKIKNREIQLGIPANTGKAQMEQIQRAVDYGKLNNVEIVITRVGK